MDLGHTDLPQHDAVNKAAKQATTFTKIIDKTRLPASDYQNQCRSLNFGNKLFPAISLYGTVDGKI